MPDPHTEQRTPLAAYEDAVTDHRVALAEYVAIAAPTPDRPFPYLPPGALVPDGLPVLARLHAAEQGAERTWRRSLP
jgi:hypothetical protein